jgi:hypothetical protein
LRSLSDSAIQKVVVIEYTVHSLFFLFAPVKRNLSFALTVPSQIRRLGKPLFLATVPDRCRIRS